MDEYDVAIVEYPVKHLVGIRTRTSGRRAQEDCPALWRTFGPCVDALLATGCGCLGAYGVSVMKKAGGFDYWATIEPSTPDIIPKGMERFDIPAGDYASCAIPNIDAVSAAYLFIYEQWPKTQSRYVICRDAPCFELFPPHWQLSDAFVLCVPVRLC